MRLPLPDRARIGHVIRRLRTVTRLDAVLRLISTPRFRAPAPLPAEATAVLLYSPANLNQVDGSTIWVRSATESLLVDPAVHITMPLRSPIRRDVITGALQRLGRVELVDRHPRIAGRPLGLTNAKLLNLVERLDRYRHFDAIVIRSFVTCQRATEWPAFRGRLWSCYILEPERDVDDPAYRSAMGEIAEASRYVVVQSEPMRELLESIVPAARGKTILLPPGIPGGEQPKARTDVPVRRLLYTGKFHPFYPIDRMVEFFVELRRDLPDLEFHVAGDKIMEQLEDEGYAPRIGRLLAETPGLVWHGSLSREATMALLAEGGVALNLWDYRYGPRMNDLVVSTKLLDYAAAAVPIVLTTTVTHKQLLGADYPLFADEIDDALRLLRRVLSEPDLYRFAAERAFAASRAFTPDAIHAMIAPYLAEARAANRAGSRSAATRVSHEPPAASTTSSTSSSS
jgi:glycosyltransferase involved in cell wall biosynthesis